MGGSMEMGEGLRKWGGWGDGEIHQGEGQRGS